MKIVVRYRVCGAYNPVVVMQGQALLIACGLGTKDSCTKTPQLSLVAVRTMPSVRFAINSRKAFCLLDRKELGVKIFHLNVQCYGL